MNKKLNTFQQVRELAGWHAIAFCATLLERMVPNYQLFCELNDFGEPTQFRNSLNVIWEYLANSKSKINFSVQLEKIESAMPDANDFDQFGVFPAIDAGIALSSTIQLILAEEPQGAVIVSKLSQGGVEAFIEASEGNDLTGPELKEHPLMQWEISFQQELLVKLDKVKVGKASATQLREYAVEEGVSNIGIELS